jgi:hypothetical protein
MEKRLLAAATSLSVEEIVGGVRALGGIVLAAHVDRPTNSLIGNLGFVPPGLDLAGLELSRRAVPADWLRSQRHAMGHGLLVSGDAHRLEEMTARTLLKVQAPTVAELALALDGQSERRVEILPSARV